MTICAEIQAALYFYDSLKTSLAWLQILITPLGLSLEKIDECN